MDETIAVKLAEIGEARALLERAYRLLSAYSWDDDNVGTATSYIHSAERVLREYPTPSATESVSHGNTE